MESKIGQLFCLISPQFLKRFSMIEHAARNTAAAPFRRRSSLVWPCKLRVLLLSIGRLCCIFGVCWGVLVTILGALGAHFGSQNRSFWVPGGPLAPRKNQSRKRVQKMLIFIICSRSFWSQIWVHFSMIFGSIFRCVFWIIFRPILDQFWEPK